VGGECSPPIELLPVLTGLLGGLLEEPPKEGEPLKLNGSAIMTYASSREEVLEQLKSDIYSTSGVWDLSKVCSTMCSVSSC
jgi:hypothetical protein